MVPKTTKSGNLNKSKIAADPQAGTTKTKDNSECSTLRAGNLPKASGVTTINRDANKGKTVKIASSCPDNNPKKRSTASWGINYTQNAKD